MAVVENIEINGDASGFEEAIEQLNKRISELENNLGNAQDEIKRLGKEGVKTTSKLSSAFKKMGAVLTAPFKVAGKAAKAFGSIAKTALSFGGAIAIIDKLTEAFQSNQQIVDALNKVLTAASIIFSKVSEAIFGAFEAQGELNGGFDATKKVLGALISGVLNVFVGIVQGIRLAVLETQLAWEKSFFGDGDPATIRRLNSSISETRAALKATGEDLLQNGKDIVNNFGEAVEEVAGAVSAATTAAVDAVKDIDLDKTLKQADRLVQLRKQAELADVQRQKIQLEYQRREEELRQLRDDETRSISERQASNQSLLDLLKEQAKLEEQQLKIKLAAAQAEYGIMKTNENLIAVKQAELELVDLRERLTGQTTEALMNQNALAKEGLEIERSGVEAATEAYAIRAQGELDVKFAAKQAATELILNEAEKAQALYDIEQERIAAQEALNEELKNKRMELIDSEMARIEASGQTETALYQDFVNQKLAIEAEYNTSQAALAGERTANEISEQKRVLENRKALNEASIQIAGQGLAAISSLQQAFQKRTEDGDVAAKKRQFQIQKRLSLASAIVSGVEAVQNAFKTALASPITALLPSYPAIQAGLAGAFAAAQVATIARSQFDAPAMANMSSSPQVASVTAASVTPQFNVVGTSGVNQLAQSIGGQNDRPVKAYVVGGEITSAQELERKKLQTASFG